MPPSLLRRPGLRPAFAPDVQLESPCGLLPRKTDPRLLDRLRSGINERQQKALLRMFREGPEGFKGGLSAGNYSTITGASPATTTRDLADLVEKDALVRTGERRDARYTLNLNRD